MWVRKRCAEIAETERRRQRRRFNPLWPLLLTLVLAFVEWLVRRDTPRPFDRSSPVTPIFFIVVFGLLYLSRVAFGRYVLFGPSPFSSSAKPNVICVQCHMTQVDTESHRCSCGGILERLDHWRWLEESQDGA